MWSWGQHGEILILFFFIVLVVINSSLGALGQVMPVIDDEIMICVSQALLTMASPEEALRALAVMHNYAPEEYKVVFLGEGNISISLLVLNLSAKPLNPDNNATILFSVQECCWSLRLVQFSSKAIRLLGAVIKICKKSSA